MAVVYEAEQISLRRRVALKLLPQTAALDSRQRERFQLEARAAALIQHPNIIPVHAVGLEGDEHYFAMQFIDGPSLAAVIRVLRGRQAEPACGEDIPEPSLVDDLAAFEIAEALSSPIAGELRPQAAAGGTGEAGAGAAAGGGGGVRASC